MGSGVRSGTHFATASFGKGRNRMNRPYMICHILSALNGKISGSFMGTASNRQIGKEYAAIRNAYQADAWLYGTTTTKEFTGFRVPVYSQKDYTVPAGDFIAKKDAELYYVSIDTYLTDSKEQFLFNIMNREQSRFSISVKRKNNE